MSQVKMYKGKDCRDGSLSMFAVRDNQICSSHVLNPEPWMTPEGFGDFDDWIPGKMKDIDIQTISEAELVLTV